MRHKTWFLVAAVGLGLALTGLLTTALASSVREGASERIPAAPQPAPLAPGITEGPWGAIAYEGVPGNAASGKCYFPFVELETNGPSTTLVIQNATASNVPYTVTLYDAVAGAAGVVTGTLPARGSVRYQPDDLVSFLSQTLPFRGAAVAYADGSIACSAQVEDGAQALDEGDGWFAYTAPYASAAELVLPFVRRGYEGWNSLLFIQNTGEAAANLNVDIQFYDADGEQVTTVTESLASHARWVIDVTNVNDLPAGFNGWARVTNSSNADTLAAVVLAEQPSGTRGVVALTAWDRDKLDYVGNVVLPRTGRAPSPNYWSTEYTLYNLEEDYQHTDQVVEYRAALNGSLSALETVTLPARANVVRSLDTVNLPEQTWDGAVHTSPGPSDTGPTGMAALGRIQQAHWGYSGLQDYYDTGNEILLPDIFRHPSRHSILTVWAPEPSLDVSVTFYNQDGTPVLMRTVDIPQYASVRFDLSDMPELGPVFEGSVHVTAEQFVGAIAEAVIVSEEPLDNYEPNDCPEDAYTITVGAAYHSYISHDEDPDWYRFEVISPSQLTITLDQLPDDYDLAVFGDLLAAPEVPDSQMVGELADGSSVDADGNLDAVGGAWFASGGAWFASGGAWFASGGAWFASGGAWFASSAQPGTESEVARTIAFEPGTYFVLVYAEGERHSEQPYRLQVQAEPLAGTGACEWTAASGPTQPTEVYTGTSAATEPLTLILYNKTRLDRTYGVAAGNTISDALGQLADLDSVRGLVVPVDSHPIVSDTYAAWSTSPNYCDVNQANVVADAIRDLVISPTLAAHDTISYVVLIGGDEQMPFRRVPDETAIGNERTYQNGVQAELGALFAAFNQGYILTDDFYGTRPGEELYWRGRGLWLPSLAVGRLVETPDEIVGLIHGYMTSDTLTTTTALVTGYDFFADCAEAISDTFDGQGLNTSTLISETWDADDLEAAWLDTAPDLASVNAHFEHWRAIPATTTAGYVENTDILNTTGDLSGTLGFSIGCHAGLNVPDNDVLVSAPETHPDLPQALARRGGYWVSNTGYGYGIDDAIEASEMLMWIFAQELGQEPNVPVGQAFVQAKQRYFGSLPSGGLSLYHEKAMIESTFYGLPMYRIGTEHTGGLLRPHSNTSRDFYGVADDDDLYSDTVTVQITLTRHSHATGDFYSVDGEVQGSPGRPIQPRTSVPLDPAPEGWDWHGALLEAGEFDDQGGFDPYVAYPVTATRQIKPASEPAFEADGWFPAKPFMINRFGERDRLVIVAGQFNREGNVERLYSEMELAVYRSTSDDYAPPVIWEVNVEPVDGGWEFDLLVTDNSGVQRVVVTYEGHSWRTLDLTQQGVSNRWQGTLSGIGDSVTFFAQAVDKAGNVALETNKRLFFTSQTQNPQMVGGITEWPLSLPRVGNTHLPFLPVVLREY